MVEELLGPKRPEYEAFLSSLVPNYEQTVKCFLDPSFFNSPIGNAMPLAMARALQCSIVIFFSDISQPPAFVSPVNIDCSSTALDDYDVTIDVTIDFCAKRIWLTVKRSCLQAF